MTSKRPRTFEEKANAILRYFDYTYSWDRARFLPKFAYLADDELDSLLRMGEEIEQYAAEVAGGLFTFGEDITTENDRRFETLRETILARYPYVDAERIKRLTASSAYNAIA